MLDNEQLLYWCADMLLLYTAHKPCYTSYRLAQKCVISAVLWNAIGLLTISYFVQTVQEEEKLSCFVCNILMQ